MKYITTIENKEYIIEIGDGSTLVVDGTEYEMDFQQLGEGNLVSLLLNQRSFEGAVTEDDKMWKVLLRGEIYDVTVQDERAYRLAKARGELMADTGEVQIKSPMPGVIVRVAVAVGDEIKQGETAVILESMKMENELKATRDAVVLRVLVNAGDTVEKDQALVIIGDPPEDEYIG